MINSVKMNEDISRLVSASDDRSVRVWSVPSGWKRMTRLVHEESNLNTQTLYLEDMEQLCVLSSTEWKRLVACWCFVATLLVSGL